MRSAPVIATFAAGLAVGCPSTGEHMVYGNPDGYEVHHLGGDSLAAEQVTLNGVALDTSSPEAVDRSVRTMIDATRAPRTVEELPASDSADLQVDFTSSHPVPPHFYGGNIQWHSKFYFDLPLYRTLLRHIRIDRMRFPAGLERGQYERYATPSAADDLGDERFRLTGQDVESFISLCKENGIAAEPQVNTAEEHPEMWADMIDQIVNELGYDLKFVAVGNEADIDTSRSPWSLYGATTLEGALQSYTDRYLEYRKAIDEVKSGLTYVYGEFANSSSVPPAVSLLGGDDPGAVSAHFYPTGGYEGQSPEDPFYPSWDHLTGDAIHGNLWTFLGNLSAGTQTLDHPELILGEFATSWGVSKESQLVEDTLGTALFDAEVHEHAKILGYDEVAYWSLSDPKSWEPWATSLIAVDEDENTMSVRPQYFVHLIYNYLYGDQIVEVPGAQTDDWSIYAAKNESRCYFMLVNRSPTATFEKVVNVTTAEGRRRLRLTLYPHSLAVVSF
jgi:hypothetical protein